MKVLILAGGLGTRLSEETNKIPKPMVEIGVAYFMAHNENLFNLWLQRFRYPSWL